MPIPSNAIPGQASLSRKREHEARLAELDIPNLPDWMFWEKTQMDTYIENNVNTMADAKIVLKHLGQFVRIIVRLLKKYEERV